MPVHRDKTAAMWNVAAVGTNAGASATQAAVALRKHVPTYIAGSGDASALVTIESPSGTPIWRKRFSGAFTFSDVLPPGEYEVGLNAAVVAKISASTSNCEVNLAGYSIDAA